MVVVASVALEVIDEFAVVDLLFAGVPNVMNKDVVAVYSLGSEVVCCDIVRVVLVVAASV